MKKTAGMNYTDKFDEDKCTKCGECFEKCPVLHLNSDVAKMEITKLINGEMTKHVLQKCTSCHSCNVICPEDANPANLILTRWHELFQKEGMPSRERFFTPHSPKNFRTHVMKKFPDDEKALVESWDDDSTCDEIMYPGCNVIATPYLTMSKIFENVTIRGSLDLCCGEMYYRKGHFDQLRAVAKKLTAHYKKMGLKKMLIPCTAGRNLFTNILPEYGAEFDFEIVHVLPWIQERIKSGNLKIVKKLDMKITIHDSCHAKAFGDEYMDIPRELLEMIGVEILEQEHIRDMKLCCGIGGGFSHSSGYHPYNITKSAYSALRSSHKPKSDAVAVYCSGCLQLMSAGQIGNPLYHKPIYHILELIQMAIGETPERRIKKRARQLVEGVIINQIPKVLSPARFTMDGLDKIEKK